MNLIFTLLASSLTVVSANFLENMQSGSNKNRKAGLILVVTENSDGFEETRSSPRCAFEKCTRIYAETPADMMKRKPRSKHRQQNAR